MLDTHQSAEELRREQSAQLATVAMLANTSARVIRLAVDGSADRIGPRSLHAFKQLLTILQSVKDEGITAEQHSDEDLVYKERNLTSGVGKLVSADTSTDANDGAWKRVLELLNSVDFTQTDSLRILDNARSRELAESLSSISAILTAQSDFRKHEQHT